ncbi:T3SS secreted effector NleG-like domain protein [Escherichia coli B112]|nr:T3SS secreted effector NleG-like domain protein [Escherichia coli B112]ERD48032.1 T3SS secreted effector NleG-like domain protein [Escherichia coli B114]
MGQVISEFMHSNDNRIELLQRRLHSCSFLVNIEEMSYIDDEPPRVSWRVFYL